MKRVAVPVVKGKLSEHFEKCNFCEIFEIDGEKVKSNEIEVPPSDIAKLPEWAKQQNITDIITYRIDKNIIKLFTKEKINLFIGINIDTSEKLIEGYVNGALKSDEKIISEIISTNE